jgi:hypothetical protein
MSKTVEIRIPKEKRIIVCTEGSLENKLYQLGIEQGKLAELERVESRLATIYGSKRTMEQVVFAFDDWLKSQLSEKDGEKHGKKV